MLKFVLVLLALIAACLASHGRYGTIQFTKTAGNARTVTFTFDASFRRTYFYPTPNVGDTVYDADWSYGDGNYEQIPLYVSGIDLNLDLIIVKWVGTHTYAGAGDYTVGWSSCCRIFALNNDASFSYAHTALVHLTSAEVAGATPNNSPSSSFPPINTVPYNTVPYIYQVTATDPENDALTFVQATPSQQGDSSSTQPTGMTLSSNGFATLNSVLAHGYWTTQQIIHDSFGNWISLDYLLDVEDPILVCSGCASSSNPQCTTNNDCATFCVNSTCVQPEPRIITASTGSPSSNRASPAAGTVFNIVVGQTITIDFVADDSKLSHPSAGPTISFYTIPPNANVGAQTACDSAHSCTCTGCNDHSQIRSISWTPQTTDANTGNVVCITADSFGNPIPAPNNPYCVTINVADLPLTTNAITSGALTTSFATVADRCATYTFPETQGFFCSADQTGYYQCLKGPWATQAAFRPCAPGTFCRCPTGVECSASGLCTF